ASGIADKNKFCVMRPSLEGYDISTVAYVTYAWVIVYSHRELRLEQDLPTGQPAGFEELSSVFREGYIGMYMVYTHDIRGNYIVESNTERARLRLYPLLVPQHCDQCDAAFDSPGSWMAFRQKQKQKHPREVHGSKEGIFSVPAE
ncbi:hypothetical protein GQ53DRAFT_672688, partial [Thozetella sp. PMI_491]